jgi:hypothetical protein
VAYDARAEVVLLYGGSNESENFDDMWQWDGVRWTRVSMDGPTPGRRSGHAMAFDANRGRTVLFGGCAYRGAERCRLADEVWEWDGAHWTEIKP